MDFLGSNPGWQEVPERFGLVVGRVPGSGSSERLPPEPQFSVVAALVGEAEAVEVAVGMLVLGQLLD